MRVTAEEKEILRNRYFRHILDASREYGWPPEIIAAIMSRESGCGLLLTPRKPGGNPGGRGDHGHGHGLMQIDDRFHQEFIKSGAWQDPRANIFYAMKVLHEFHAYLRKHSGLAGDELRAAAIAGYNCGPGNVLKSLAAGKNWDAKTTGGDYSEDVLARSRELRSLFQGADAVSSPGPVAVIDPGQCFRVKAAGLNFRTEPVVSPANRIAVLPQGHPVTKIGEAADPRWWKVTATVTLEGFVARQYLIPEKDEAKVAVIKGS